MESLDLGLYPNLCRVCLTGSGQLKNIVEWNLLDDFSTFAGIQMNNSDETYKCICIDCEYNLTRCKTFRLQCQRSDILIKQALEKVNRHNNAQKHNVVHVKEETRPPEISITYQLTGTKLTFLVTAEDMTSKISFPCPYGCSETFFKKKYLLSHLNKRHGVDPSFFIDIQFFCSVPKCQYHVDSKNKHFTERKFLNQHFNKVHKSQVYFCGDCSFSSASESDLNRHLATCNIRFVCSLCNVQFKTNETLMVHLMRKHPEEHKQYKAEKKEKKDRRVFNNVNSNKDETYGDILKKNIVTSEMTGNNLIFKVVVVNSDETVTLKCPISNCEGRYITKTNFIQHYTSSHGVRKSEFTVDLRFYCSYQTCEFYLNSNNKYFKDKTSVKHHYNERHRDDFFCRICNFSFTKRFAYEQHLDTCNINNFCQICKIQFDNKDIFHEHLLDSHPNLHKLITERSRKRNIEETVTSNKKQRIDSTKSDYFCDSPKRSFATQTLDIEANIRNDVTLTPWNPKTDEISTQTVFEDLLSLKSQNSEEDSLFFAETVSLSDIQTQTFPIEFGLSRSNKETITSETQSPDLSIKETQTCVCLYESPKLNFRLFDSVSSSPSSSINLTSAQTQTSEANILKSDVMLGFNSAQTQTTFEEDLGRKSL